MIVHYFPDFIGMIGVLLTLLAYLFLQINWMRIEGYSYSSLNAAGSLCILFSLYFQWNSPAAVIEIAWFLISLYGILKAASMKRENS